MEGLARIVFGFHDFLLFSGFSLSLILAMISMYSFGFVKLDLNYGRVNTSLRFLGQSSLAYSSVCTLPMSSKY